MVTCMHYTQTDTAIDIIHRDKMYSIPTMACVLPSEETAPGQVLPARLCLVPLQARSLVYGKACQCLTVLARTNRKIPLGLYSITHSQFKYAATTAAVLVSSYANRGLAVAVG